MIKDHLFARLNPVVRALTAVSLLAGEFQSPHIVQAQVPPSQTWEAQGVSTMKLSKDRVCDQLSHVEINLVASRAKELGATHLAIETPYDNPDCGSALIYTRNWVSAARAQGLNVIHRHMFTRMEGIYGQQKDPTLNYSQMIYDYIITNPDLFAAGDFVMPIPEPDNAGIRGFNCGSGCMFPDTATFNTFVRQIYGSTTQALAIINHGSDVQISCCSFSGFTAAGLDNPDWTDGILEQQTQLALGKVISLDHYPQSGYTMAGDLAELHQIHPDWTVDMGEWGAIDTNNPVSVINASMTAAIQPWIRSFGYWHIGPEGTGEGLLDDNFDRLPAFYAVQDYFKKPGQPSNFRTFLPLVQK